MEDLACFVKGENSFTLPKLQLSAMDRFLVLAPRHPSAQLDGLAERCVRYFDSYRQPPCATEMMRQRSVGLNSIQEQYLKKWGYPYVMDQFRFHLTLTGPIHDSQFSARLTHAIEAHVAALDLNPIPFRSICLFVQQDAKQPFLLYRRYEFSGQ